MIRRWYKIMALVAALAAAVGLVGCQAGVSAQSAAPQTATIQRGTLTAFVNSAGTVAAKSQVALAFQASGQIKEIDVQPGDPVKAGQTLAKLDTTDLELGVRQAQASLDTAKLNLQQTQAGPQPADVASAKSSLASAYAAYQAALDKNKLTNEQIIVARAQLDKAAAALQRAQLAYNWELGNWLDKDPQNSQQKQSLDDAQTAYDLAQASYNQVAAGINDSSFKAATAQLTQAQYQLESLLNTPSQQDLTIAQAQVKQAEASLAQAQSQLAGAILVAPFDGTVASVSVQVGQIAGSGTQAVTLADLSQMQVAVTLAETDLPKVQVGQAVQMTLDAVPGVTFSGRVDEVDLVGTTTQGVVNYPATVVITDSNSDIRPGMNASVGIVVAQRENVLLVPNRAVRTTGNLRQVTVLYQGQQIAVPVTLGLSGDTQSEVLSGLQEGDVVLLNATTTTTSSGGGGGGILFGR